MNKNMLFCQSCGMPLTHEKDFGTEKDGSKNTEYCVYCYKNGAFTANCTMEQMIDFCAPIMVRDGEAKTEEEAKQKMLAYFPQLKRWKTTQ